MAFESAETLATTFRLSVRAWIPAGLSGNQMLSSARSLGFGINRQHALDIIREEREAQRTASEAAGAATEVTAFQPAREYKWGTLTQDTGHYQRYDGPHALLFQVGGDAGPDWLDYVILPEDAGAVSMRFITEEDEPSDPNDTRNAPYYRTSGPVPADVRVRRAAERLRSATFDPDRVVRVIFDRP